MRVSCVCVCARVCTYVGVFVRVCCVVFYTGTYVYVFFFCAVVPSIRNANSHLPFGTLWAHQPGLVGSSHTRKDETDRRLQQEGYQVFLNRSIERLCPTPHVPRKRHVRLFSSPFTAVNTNSTAVQQTTTTIDRHGQTDRARIMIRHDGCTQLARNENVLLMTAVFCLFHLP